MKEPSVIFQGKVINTDRTANKHALPGTRVNYFRAREQILSLKFNEDVRAVPFPPAGVLRRAILLRASSFSSPPLPRAPLSHSLTDSLTQPPVHSLAYSFPIQAGYSDGPAGPGLRRNMQSRLVLGCKIPAYRCRNRGLQLVPRADVPHQARPRTACVIRKVYSS